MKTTIVKSVLIVGLLVLWFFTTGCSSLYYHPRYPVLEKPDRPTLSNVSASEMKKMSQKAQETVTHNFDLLINYIRKLEATVDGYNEYAVQENKNLKSGEKK